MRKVPLNKEVLLARLEEIRKDLAELKVYQKMDLSEFRTGKNFAIAEHYLRRALEAVFDIGSHILSRIPGGRATTYKEIADLLGKYRIVPRNFAQKKLVRMAGYRNRLIHFYLEINEIELLKIIQRDLPDVEGFCRYIAEVISRPEKFGLLCS
ncbi:MAG: DUF86 domain-containing protein [Candidatus Omnitrophica bacterium]|nr:DUF86 domain-containing protein [Candidatus Omnitrophota bacterium]